MAYGYGSGSAGAIVYEVAAVAAAGVLALLFDFLRRERVRGRFVRRP